MKMYFLQFRCSPFPKSKNSVEYGGAFINCWIKSENKNSAIILAKKQIRKDQWEIENVEEVKIITKEFYDKEDSGFPYYSQAILDGQCFVIHTWQKTN